MDSLEKTKSLLPPNLVGDKNIEALCESADHVFALNAELYKLLIYSRIDELPEEVLDLLAWQFHIEDYEFAEDIWEKRKLIKEFYELHKIKGTVAGIKRALELAKAKPLRIYTPLDKTFLSLSMNDEERKAWFSLFPELRLKRFKARGKGRANKFLGDIYPFFSDAPLRFGYRAYYIYKKQVIPLQTFLRLEQEQEKIATEIVQVKEPSIARGIFYRLQDRFLVDHEARKRIYTLRFTKTYTDVAVEKQIKVITPKLTPVTPYWEEICEKGQWNRKSAFVWSVAGHTTILDANERIYKRLRVYDEEVIAYSRKPFTFLNEKPIAIPAYHAEVWAEIRGKYLWRNFLQELPKTKLTRAIKMLNSYKSVRDKILLNTKTKRVPVADGTITAGMNITAQEVINV